MTLKTSIGQNLKIANEFIYLV